MRQIQSAQMPITGQPKITHLDSVWPHVANRCRTNEKSVLVIFDASPIVVVVETSLNCITLTNEVLTKNICDVYILMARVEGV